MKKRKAKLPSAPSVYSVDPYNGTMYALANEQLIAETATYSKHQTILSYINSNDCITQSISISRHIPEEDVINVIENKVYEELALDMALEYDIQYIELLNHSEPENRLFNVFVVEPNGLDGLFEPVRDKVKYIDSIVPEALLLSGLYKKEIIEDNGVHCFVYIHNKSAMLTLYNDREFLYTKAIKYSLSQLFEMFCEKLGEKITPETFLALFGTESTNTNSDFTLALNSVITEVLLHINDVTTYAKRAFSLYAIDKVYFGTSAGALPSISDIATGHLDAPCLPFLFDYRFDNKKFYIDQTHQLIHLYHLLDEFQQYECNFTHYYRPPSFIKRQSGKMIAVVAAGTLLAFSYPIFYYTLGTLKSFQLALLEEEYKSVHNEKAIRENILRVKSQELEQVKVKLNNQVDAYNTKKNTLIKIEQVKVHYPMKAKILTAFTTTMNEHNVYVDRIDYHQNGSDKYFIFELDASSDNEITLMIKDLTAKNNSLFNYSMELLALDSDSDRYKCELKVALYD